MIFAGPVSGRCGPAAGPSPHGARARLRRRASRVR
jgi:hypothetical protein